MCKEKKVADSSTTRSSTDLNECADLVCGTLVGNLPYKDGYFVSEARE